MRLFVFILALFIFIPADVHAQDADGINEVCKTKLNRKREAYDCQCVVEKYYPKKNELSQLYGMPISGDQVLMHVTESCLNLDTIVTQDYNNCINSPTFKEERNLYGKEAYCGCYSKEVKKELEAFRNSDMGAVFTKSRQHIKTKARMNCTKILGG